MKNDSSVSNPFITADYVVLLGALLLGAFAIPFNMKIVLPAAAVFGWCQIGGV
jgi:hypothetical protein